MRVEIANVDVERAMQLLALNTNNVPLREGTVRKYVRDMTNGLWVPETGEPILVDTENVLVNGQHRLHAIVRSGITVRMVIVWGVSIESRRVVDQVRIRPLIDVAHMNGIPGFDRAVSATLVPMIRGWKKTSAQRTQQEKFAFFDRHRAAIEFAISVLPDTDYVSRGIVYAAIGRAYYHEPHQRLTEFGQVLHTGMPLGPEDRAAIVLRDHLLANRVGPGGNAVQAVGYRKISRALMAFCEKKPLTKLYESNEELYPLPEETQDLHVHEA